MKEQKILKNQNFKTGLGILKKYELTPTIIYMGNDEYYVGDMNVWENKISDEEIRTLLELGFHWYEEAECLLFNGSSEPIH